MKWAKFLAALTPELIELGRVLYQRFKGDAVAAKTEITRIKNHGLALDAERVATDDALNELREQVLNHDFEQNSGDKGKQ